MAPASTVDLATVLASANLSSFASRFAAQEITSVALVEELSAADFVKLGLTIGKRIALKDALAKLRIPAPPPPPPPPASSPPAPPYEADPTVAPLRSPLSLPTRTALLPVPTPYNDAKHPHGHGLKYRSLLMALVQDREARLDPRKRCPHIAFQMKVLDGLGAVGSRCVAALIQAAALGLPNTRCTSMRSGVELTALWQLLPSASPPPATLPGPHYCHRTGTFHDNIASIEGGNMVNETVERKARSIGTERWWSVMQCWRADGWRWLDTALTDGEGEGAADARCVFQIPGAGLTGSRDFNKQRKAALTSSVPKELISAVFQTRYSRTAARERLRQLRRFLVPRLNSTRCGYDGGGGGAGSGGHGGRVSISISNVAWHMRAGDLCDATSNVQAAHFDSAYDAMRRLANGSSNAVAIHIFTEAEPLPTATAVTLPCLGPRLRLRGCLALDAASGVCTVFRAALDGTRAGPLSTIRVLVNGEPFGTLACMAAADRIMVAIPSSFSNLAVIMSPESVPVEFGDVWWRRCVPNKQSSGLLYTRLTRCIILRLLAWAEPERYPQLNGSAELNTDFSELPRAKLSANLRVDRGGGRWRSEKACRNCTAAHRAIDVRSWEAICRNASATSIQRIERYHAYAVAVYGVNQPPFYMPSGYDHYLEVVGFSANERRWRSSCSSLVSGQAFECLWRSIVSGNASLSRAEHPAPQSSGGGGTKNAQRGQRWQRWQAKLGAYHSYVKDVFGEHAPFYMPRGYLAYRQKHAKDWKGARPGHGADKRGGGRRCLSACG